LNFLEDTAKGAQHPPLLDPCLLWPRSPISATAELLLYIHVFSTATSERAGKFASTVSHISNKYIIITAPHLTIINQFPIQTI